MIPRSSLVKTLGIIMHTRHLLPTLGLYAFASSAAIAKRQSVSTSLPAGWTYQGCYPDSVSDRVLSGASYRDSTGMTEESCITYCASAGFTLAGVEYAGLSLVLTNGYWMLTPLS